MKKNINVAGKSHYTVFPGEHFATGEDCIIETISGSCVVVCLYDPEKKIGGMGHFIVPGKIQPDSAGHDEVLAKGITELEFLFGEMVKLGGDRRRIRASVYGAAMITTPGDPGLDDILMSNMRFLREYFSLENIPVVNDGMGGISRKRISFYTSNGNVLSEAAPGEAGDDGIPGREHEYIQKTLGRKDAFGKIIFFDSIAYETLISLIPDIIYRIDHRGTFTYLSDSIFKLGYEPADLLGSHFSVLVHPEDLPLVQRSIVVPRIVESPAAGKMTPKLFDERRTGRRITRDLRVRLIPGGRDHRGEYALGEVICTGHYEIREDGRNYTGTIGIIRDISEVASAQRALEQTERFYKNLLNSSSDVLFMLTLEGTILFVNDSVVGVTGYTNRDLIGENELDFTHDEDKPAFSGILNSPAGIFYGNLVEHRFRHVNGSMIVFESTVYKILDEEQNPILIILHSRDVTARKLAEQQLRSALKEKEVLLKEIHHRVKNNMQIIMSLLNLQAGRVDDATVVNHLRETQNRIRAIALIHDKLYRSEDLAKIDFRSYLKAVIDELFMIYSVDRQKIALDIEMDAIELGIDKAIPCGLLINEVVTNSLKHAFPRDFTGQGRVRIAMNKLPDGRLALEIGDNGVGLPADLTSKTEKTLGLLLINILAKEQLQGKLSMDGPGTRVSVSFTND